MIAARIGVLLAAVVVGPPLYELVQSGGLAWEAAVQRALVVAVACVAGVAGIGRLAAAYEAQGRRQERLDAAQQAITETATALRGAQREGRPAAEPLDQGPAHI